MSGKLEALKRDQDHLEEKCRALQDGSRSLEWECRHTHRNDVVDSLEKLHASNEAQVEMTRDMICAIRAAREVIERPNESTSRELYHAMSRLNRHEDR